MGVAALWQLIAAHPTLVMLEEADAAAIQGETVGQIAIVAPDCRASAASVRAAAAVRRKVETAVVLPVARRVPLDCRCLACPAPNSVRNAGSK